MLGVALFFIGAVLVVNGVGLTGRIEAKESAPFNFIVGFLTLFINFFLLTKAQTNLDFLNIAGGLLFSFTYLYLSVVQWYGLNGTGVGWYCLFVAISAVVNAAFTPDLIFSGLWVLWASLWLFFFIALALKKNLAFLPIYTILIGIGTCWIPGFLMLFGKW